MAALARFEELRLKLVDWKLEQYGPPLFDAGFDDLSYLQQLDRARLEEVAADAGMKKGHAAKFIAYLLRGQEVPVPRLMPPAGAAAAPTPHTAPAAPAM